MENAGARQRKTEQTLMKQEQKKQVFSSFFEDCFSTRNIIENSIRNWKIL